MSNYIYIAFAIAVGVLLIQAIWDNHYNPPGGCA
jgi:hypothetical protein